ncbi:hypothetical protein [Negadavirga shengliensis]|uniref:Lipoprotein n=1 Tax=Negadavirga shengliensis TaxID=1389218 RepID=A0ABV9SW62_9BACT
MKKAIAIMPIVLLLACSDDITLPGAEHPPEEQVHPVDKDPVCHFDLTSEEDDYELLGEWEFVGFQDLKSGEISGYTCLARWAHAIISGYENNPWDYDYPLFLNLRDVAYSGNDPACQGWLQMETITHSTHYIACFQIFNADSLHFQIGEEHIKSDRNIYTFPEIDHHDNYVHGLENTTRFETEANRLYFYYDSDKYRMVFISMMKNKEEG